MPDDTNTVAAINARISDLSASLQAHITDCSTQSRRLFWAVVGVLGWLVAHGLFPKIVGI